jgi:UDP-glucose 4-epimerase
MSYLLTGATGLIGHYLIRELLKKEDVDNIVVYDLYPNIELIDDILSSVTVIQADILDKEKLLSTVKKYQPKYIIHGAALRYDACYEDPTECIRVNCIGTNNVFEAARFIDTERVVYMSSGNVYGSTRSYYWKEEPVTVNEDDPSTSMQPYGLTKWVNEVMARIYYEKYALDSIGFRITGVWGHGRYGGKGTVGYLNAYLRDVGLERDVEIPTKLRGRKNLTWVYGKNAAKWLIQACLIPELPRRVYCMGTKTPYSFNDVLEIVVRLIPGINVDNENKTNLSPSTKKKDRFGGVIDCRRMYEELGFEEDFNLEQSISDFLNYHRRNKGLPVI